MSQQTKCVSIFKTKTYMKKKLILLLEKNQRNITEAVINEALEYDTPEAFFNDLLQHGCQS